MFWALLFAAVAQAQELRSPSAEIWSVRVADALTIVESRLTDTELVLVARSVFQNSLDYGVVRVVFVPSWTGEAYQTSGNVIRVPMGSAFPPAILIHELMHVWQFQTRGTAFLSNCFLHRKWAWLTQGDERFAYLYKHVPGKALDAYPAEQQAELIEDLFSGEFKPGKEEAERLLGEVRRSRPVFTRGLAYDEYAVGLPPRDRPIQAFQEPAAIEAPGVPGLELRF